MLGIRDIYRIIARVILGQRVDVVGIKDTYRFIAGLSEASRLIKYPLTIPIE